MSRIITTKSGDILKAKENLICHQVNAQAVMGAGLAAQIKQQFPMVEKEYIEFCLQHQDRKELLGKAQFCSIAEEKWIVNMFSQLDFGQDANKVYTDYDAFKKALKAIRNFCKPQGYSVAFPYKIGCGLANGDWETVLKLIQEELEGCEVTIYKFQG